MMIAILQRWGRRVLTSPSPLVKLAVWVVAVAILATVVQLLAWSVGWPLDILAQSKSGRGVLLTLALGVLLGLMAYDRRSAADYGLVIGEDWRRQSLMGIGWGMGSYLLYCGLAVACGALKVNPDATPSRWMGALGTAAMAFPLAISQQIVFSGYLLSLFRNRCSTLVSILWVSALFALASKLGDFTSLSTPAGYALPFGMFLVAGLLAMLRLLHGTVLAPAGVLAGWIVARRLLKSTHLLATAGLPNAQWWAPGNDPRQAPILWVFLAATWAIVAWRLSRAAPAESAPPSMAKSFKRVAPFSHMSMLAPLDLWLSRLWAARFRVGLAYAPRLSAILLFSAVNTLLTLPERCLLPWLLRKQPVKPPLFILGVHRSGTTHLQNLLALDPRLVSPNTLQVMNPHGFLVSGWAWAPFLLAFAPWKRPMDSVRFHAFAPNEEEFALAGVSRLSPYWGLTFPSQTETYDRYIYPENFSASELATWRKKYIQFLRALVWRNGRRPLLKNPHNTARMAQLREMFPDARFVHIFRQPYAVYRSNMHLAAEGHCMYQLQDAEPKSGYTACFLDNYRKMEESLYRDAQRTPSGRFAEICFEDLERQPLAELRRLYDQLQLEWSAEFEKRVEAYLAGLRGYQKNEFKTMEPALRNRIYEKLEPLFERWGYNRDGHRTITDRASAA